MTHISVDMFFVIFFGVTFGIAALTTGHYVTVATGSKAWGRAVISGQFGILIIGIIVIHSFRA